MCAKDFSRPIRISPKYDADDWKELRSKQKWEEGEWNKAVDMFEDRIRGRFLDIIDTIEGKEYAGLL